MKTGNNLANTKMFVQMFFKHWPKYHKNVFGKCLFDVKMYGRDLGEKNIFTKRLWWCCKNVFQTFSSAYTKMFDKCFENVCLIFKKCLSDVKMYG